MRKIALFLLCFAVLPASSGRIFALERALGNDASPRRGGGSRSRSAHVGATTTGSRSRRRLRPKRAYRIGVVDRVARVAALRLRRGQRQCGKNDYLPAEAGLSASVTSSSGTIR